MAILMTFKRITYKIFSNMLDYSIPCLKNKKICTIHLEPYALSTQIQLIKIFNFIFVILSMDIRTHLTYFKIPIEKNRVVFE
jgi:hypothetical protein